MNDLPRRLEGFLRDEPGLADEIAIVRGGPIDPGEFRRNVEDTMRAFTWRGAPLIGVSVEAAVEGWSVERLLSEGRVRRRATYAECSAGAIKARGWRLLPSFRTPHHTLLLSGYTEDELHTLFILFRGGARPNPFRR